MLPYIVLPSMFWMLFPFLMLLSQVQGEILGKEEYYAPVNCPTGSMTYYSHCYALIMSPVSWMEANMDCRKYRSGNLVSILSRSEGSFVSALVKNNFNNYYDAWIGLHDVTEGCQVPGRGWEWSSGDLLNYIAWEKLPPNSSSYNSCGSVTQSSGFQKWKDYNCDFKLPYICKFRT